MTGYLLLYKQYAKKYSNVIEYTRRYLDKTAAKKPSDLHPWSLSEYRMKHIMLVLKNSFLLARNRKKLNLDVIALSAILHDVATFSSARKEHAEEGARVAEEYLRKHGYPDNLVQAVVHSIRVHAGPLVLSPRSDEAKILQDADTFDKVGAASIAIFLLHYGSRKMLPGQALAELKKEMPKRLRWCYRTMNFPEGKRMIGEGCKYTREFIKKLESETYTPEL